MRIEGRTDRPAGRGEDHRDGAPHVRHYLVRNKSRDYWRHLVAPVIGFVILALVVVNAEVAAQRLGFVWLDIGVVLLVGLFVSGRRPQLSAIDETENP